MDPVTAAIIGGTSLLGGIASGMSSSASAQAALQGTMITNMTNHAIAKETNQANLDLYREQYRDQLAMWEKQNEYNTPAKEVARLRSAGLNPALTFGQAAQAGSMSVPSAHPAVGATMQTAPYEAYSDTFMHGFLDAMPGLTDAIQKMSDVGIANDDVIMRKQMHLKKIDEMDAMMEKMLEDTKLTSEQRKTVEEQRDTLRLQRQFLEDTYGQRLESSELQNKYQELLNRSIDEKIAADAARLAIEKAESAARIKLSTAQQFSVYKMAELAVNADWRAEKSHEMEMTLKAIDKEMKTLNLSESERNAIWQEVWNRIELPGRAYSSTSEEKHARAKDMSLLNWMMEYAFGLGLRDVGGAISSMTKVVK